MYWYLIIARIRAHSEQYAPKLGWRRTERAAPQPLQKGERKTSQNELGSSKTRQEQSHGRTRETYHEEGDKSRPKKQKQTH